MKYLLTGSLILNGILIYKLFTESQRPALERIVIEEKVAEKIRPRVPVPTVQIAPKQALKHSSEVYDTPVETTTMAPAVTSEIISMEDWQDEVDKIETAKRRFFEKEGIDHSVMDKITKIKQDYQKNQQAILKESFQGEIPLKERRDLLDIEEKYQKQLQDAFGKKNWEKFQAFKNRYNQSVFKKLSDQGGSPRPYVPMDI